MVQFHESISIYFVYHVYEKKSERVVCAWGIDNSDSGIELAAWFTINGMYYLLCVDQNMNVCLQYNRVMRIGVTVCDSGIIRGEIFRHIKCLQLFFKVYWVNVPFYFTSCCVPQLSLRRWCQFPNPFFISKWDGTSICNLNLNYINNKIYNTDLLCRFCEEEDETSDHFINECPCFYLDRCEILKNEPIINDINWTPDQLQYYTLLKLKPFNTH